MLKQIIIFKLKHRAKAESEMRIRTQIKFEIGVRINLKNYLCLHSKILKL